MRSPSWSQNPCWYLFLDQLLYIYILWIKGKFTSENSGIFLTDFTPLLVLHLTVIEGRLIITGHSMGGSVASLFTLCLLEVINISKPKCRPICITFGSPLIGDFGFQHSNWNSFFLHVVSNQDLVPGLFLPSGRSPPTSSHSQTTGYKPFGTYLLCSELGCACFDNPDLILELLKVISSEVAGGLRDVDYRKILINLKERAIFKGLQQVGERFADPLSFGIIMDLEIIGFDQTKVNSFLPINDVAWFTLNFTKTCNNCPI